MEHVRGDTGTGRYEERPLAEVGMGFPVRVPVPEPRGSAKLGPVT